MNPTSLFGITRLWTRFSSNHPKFPGFVRTCAAKGLREGMVIDVAVTDTDGETIRTNVKLTADDIAIFEELKTFGNREE